jgi:alkylglycerol monooxygenase
MQFWVHSTGVRRLPWGVEMVFNTPSHHRVHHDRRVHGNYAGVLIIWDRLLGTFITEGDDATTKEVRSIQGPVP